MVSPKDLVIPEKMKFNLGLTTLDMERTIISENPRTKTLIGGESFWF
jgi:hypothetical protein